MRERIVILGIYESLSGRRGGLADDSLPRWLAAAPAMTYTYVEAHGCTPSKLMQSRNGRRPGSLAALYPEDSEPRFGLEHNWAYHALYPERGISG